MESEKHISRSSEETFAVGESIGLRLRDGNIVLLYGGLGAGKTLLTKGILNALDFDIDEVTSPSFTLVNLYKTPAFDVYHIDLWRLDDGADATFALGLDEIFETENSVAIIEWAERLGEFSIDRRVIKVKIAGDGDETRGVSIEWGLQDDD